MNIEPNNTIFNNTESSIVELPNASLYEYENPIKGVGNNRTLRTFLQNSSESSGVNKFNISSDANDEFLNKGQYNFTFDKSFNTTYTLEDDTPFVSPNTDFVLNEETSLENNITIIESSGTFPEDLNASIVAEDYNFLNIPSTTGTPKSAKFNFSTEFSTLKINQVIGFIFELKLRVLDNPADLNISIYDLIEQKWDKVYSSLNYEVMGSYQLLTFNITNTNLRYLNATQDPQFSFSFYNQADTFEIRLDYVSIKLRLTNEIYIRGDSGNEYEAALEFNIMGNSTFYGFQAWVRSFNVTDVGEEVRLSVELYHTNLSSPVKRSDLVGANAINKTEQVSRIGVMKNFTNYSLDEPFWFDMFPSGEFLEIGNYFIVISSNTTDNDGGKGFSLVTLPYNEFQGSYHAPSDKESKRDHLLLEGNSTGWSRSQVSRLTAKFDVDAAAFSINLTRPYRPSEIEAKIENEDIVDTFISVEDYPYDDIGDYATTWWGFGTIDHTYDTPIQATYNNFEVILSWNASIYSGNIDLDVRYNVEKYYDENATSNYTLILGENPTWNVSYYFDNTSSKFDNWNFTEMWYFVPEDWTLKEFLGPNQIDYMVNTTYSTFEDNQNVLKVNSTIVENGTSGVYLLNAESNNYIKICSLQLHYNEYKWTTNGFMPGDNVSIAVGVSDSDGRWIQNNGEITARLYNKTGDLVSMYTLYDNSIKTNDTHSWYEFQSQDIFFNTESVPTGIYNVVVNWTNGDEVGFLKRELYLNNYNASILDFHNYNEEKHSNQIYGRVIDAFDTDIGTYDLYLYAIKNLTTAEFSNEYFINRSSNDHLGSNTELYLVDFMQNETVLNANEDVNFIINLENRHSTINYNVSITAELISLINPENEWIISSGSSGSQNLAISGDPNGNDQKQFEFSLSIPTPEEGGVNCPIRNGPMAIKLIIIVDGDTIFEQIQEEYLYYTPLSDTEFEGDVCQPIKIYEDRIGPTFIASFDRLTMDLPENITYYVQVVNDYFMGTENEVFKPSELYKVDGDILNFQIEQNVINRISTLNLTGQAVDEYSNPLASIDLEFKYNDSTNWVPFDSTSGNNQITTDEKGFFNFEFSLVNTPILPNLEIITSYAGNESVLAFNKTLNITLHKYNNEIDLIFENKTLVKPVHNIISFKIVNTGNSTLENVTLSIIEDNSTYDTFIYSVNILKNAILLPGEYFTIDIDFFDSKYNENFANITIKVEAFVREIGEQKVLLEEQYTFQIYSVNESQLSSTTVVFFFFVGAGLLWVFGGLFIKKNISEFNTIPDTYVSEKKAKKRRTGKYVNVADLSRKSEKKPEGSEESSTSLDDLLDEEETK